MVTLDRELDPGADYEFVLLTLLGTYGRFHLTM